MRAVGMGMRGMSLMSPPPLFAFAAGRFGVLEIGRKLQIRLRNSKSPYLQVAKAIHARLPFEGFDTGSIAVGEVTGIGREIMVRNAHVRCAYHIHVAIPLTLTPPAREKRVAHF